MSVLAARIILFALLVSLRSRSCVVAMSILVLRLRLPRPFMLRRQVGSIRRVSCSLMTRAELPVVDRLGLASDAEDFIRICSGLGLEMSERTAHRILAGPD